MGQSGQKRDITRQDHRNVTDAQIAPTHLFLVFMQVGNTCSTCSRQRSCQPKKSMTERAARQPLSRMDPLPSQPAHPTAAPRPRAARHTTGDLGATAA
jgi:hypothetical protein